MTEHTSESLGWHQLGNVEGTLFLFPPEAFGCVVVSGRRVRRVWVWKTALVVLSCWFSRNRGDGWNHQAVTKWVKLHFQVGGIGHWRGFHPSGLCQSEHIRYPLWVKGPWLGCSLCLSLSRCLQHHPREVTVHFLWASGCGAALNAGHIQWGALAIASEYPLGQDGKPKTITGFQAHTAPEMWAHWEQEELATEEFLPVTPVLEGFVILWKNPNGDL